MLICVFEELEKEKQRLNSLVTILFSSSKNSVVYEKAKKLELQKAEDAPITLDVGGKIFRTT